MILPITLELTSTECFGRTRPEARTRWLAGRAVESLDRAPETLALVAELVEPGLAADAFERRLAEARDAVRSAWERVTEAGSIAAL